MHHAGLLKDPNAAGSMIHQNIPSYLFFTPEFITVVYFTAVVIHLIQNHLMYSVEACADPVPQQHACHCTAIQGDDVNGKRISIGSPSKRQIEEID